MAASEKQIRNKTKGKEKLTKLSYQSQSNTTKHIHKLQ
jgi:hypothetical protein